MRHQLERRCKRIFPGFENIFQSVSKEKTIGYWHNQFTITVNTRPWPFYDNLPYCKNVVASALADDMEILVLTKDRVLLVCDRIRKRSSLFCFGALERSPLSLYVIHILIWKLSPHLGLYRSLFNFYNISQLYFK